MINMFQILKQIPLIIVYNVVPYYVGKNWSKIDTIYKSNKIPLTLHK
jgi:hypothetical protein